VRDEDGFAVDLGGDARQECPEAGGEHQGVDIGMGGVSAELTQYRGPGAGDLDFDRHSVGGHGDHEVGSVVAGQHYFGLDFEFRYQGIADAVLEFALVGPLEDMGFKVFGDLEGGSPRARWHVGICAGRGDATPSFQS
jgi:hypothetical protein